MTDQALKSAADAIKAGQVVGVPTETVYGLAADPNQADAVAALFEMKGRPADKPFALLAASAEQAATVAIFNDEAAALAKEHWPGPLTLVLPRHPDMPGWLGEPARGTVGVRVPAHDVALALLDASGPLVVTSANWSGDPAVLDHAAAARVFGDAVAVYLEGEAGGGDSSTVVDLTRKPPKLVRPGPVAWAR